MENRLTQKLKDEKINELITTSIISDDLYWNILNSRIKYCFYRVLYGIGITLNTENGVDKKPIIKRIKTDLLNCGIYYNDKDVNNVLDVVISKRKFTIWEMIIWN